MNNDLKAVFREGALEFMLELEQALLHLEENPENTTEIDRMFRVMHTIKGSAAMVELNDIARFAHTLESECDYIRQGHTRVTPEIIKMALKAHDHILAMIEMHFDGDAVSPEASEELLTRFKEVRVAATSSMEKGKYGTDRLFGIIEKILVELELAKDMPDKKKTLYSAGSSITMLYHLCIILSKESPAEFINDFEKVYRQARVMNQKLPDNIIELTIEAIGEVKMMLDDSPVDEMSFDPESILRALQRPMEIREKLNQVCEMILESEVALPPQHKYRIKISAPDRGPGSSSGKERFTGLLQRIGEMTVINQDGNEAEGLILQMTKND